MPKDDMPLAFVDETPWRFRIALRRDASKQEYVVEGLLQRGGETPPLSAAVLVTAGGLVFWRG